MSGEAPITLFSTLAVQAALETAILPPYVANSPYRIQTTYAPTAVLLDQVAAGARPDVLIATTIGINDLSMNSIVDSSTAVPIAVAGVGIAVQQGADAPDISTVVALVNTLTAARSVAYSQTGASGRYFAGLLTRLGISDIVGDRATVIQQGFVASAVVDGRADLAVQQLSELMLIDGVTVVGPLPDEVQHYTEFSVARSSAVQHPAAAGLLSALTTPAAQQAYRATGLQLPRR